MKKNLIPLSSFLLLVSSFLLLVSPIHAQNFIGLSAIPPRLEIQIKPGEVLTKEIKVRNESNIEKVITTNIKDFIVADDAGTPISLESADTDNRWAAASWIQVSPSTLKLKPGETRSLIVSIVAPDDATAGGHYTMILHTPQNQTMLDQSGALIETNVGTLLYITVPGDIKEKALVADFSAPRFLEYGPVNFKTIVNNLSDIHISPIGQITIKNILGLTTATLDLDRTNIFPYTSREFQNVLNKKWLFGRFQATLNAGYGTTGQALIASLFFWVIPWKLIILLIASLIIIFVIVKLAKQKRSSPPSSENGKVEELEKELENLKKKYQDR
jgi:hypothetical protein